MASNTLTAEVSSQQDWKGGKSPFSVSYGKLMMWYFLVSDAFTFSALLISYGAIRFSSATWADPNHVFNSMPFLPGRDVPLGFVSIMTFILILSSVFVVRAVQEGHMMNQAGVMKWMFLGILGGAAFLGCQAWEWTHLISHGTSLYHNPHGPPAFGQLFFLITGFHGFHVFSGVLINIIIFIQAGRGVYQRRGHYEMVEKVGLYWHFVDLVWVFVFMAFYLL
ncbi:cytochrome oxidase subunit III [Sphingobacteriales bacterium UPWRP_1]|nr:cytochrome oxidase subunit III [Sphingobacteriales bacterium TSM_CSM]PSJ78048.1 cytochrome oxidase subunit III [Sphingobacteriales bacterium UPWRP_1]